MSRLTSELKDSYGAWLASLPWDFFLTITFREPVPMRRQESVTHAVGRTLKSRYETIGVLALFAEPHLSQNLHLHGLVKIDGRDDLLNFCRQDMQRYLSEKFGRSQAAFPRGHGAVTAYVAKYCIKLDGYYEFF
ncbi:MAG TPA: hypothetical protein EYN66_15745 [Myxococcales bacterium]|nr:hypothetical protein [Myxococcales bacterium]